MRVVSVRISNWKSFGFTKNPEWIDFKGLNIIIGPNSHGKTNFGNALRLILFGGPDYGGKPRGEITEKECNDAHKPITIDAKVTVDGKTFTLNNEYSYDQLNKCVINNHLPDKRVRGRFFPFGTRQPIHLLGHQVAFHGSDQTNAVAIQENWSEIRSDMSSYFSVDLPITPPARPHKDDPNYLSDITDENVQLISETGSGIVSALFFVMEIKKQRAECKVFLIEEPENHMHPSLLRKFLTYLVSLTEERDMQFFIITHSSILIDNSILPEHNATVLYVKKEKGASQIIDVTLDLTGKWNLLYDQLGYKPSDILLSNTVIWVEGPSDSIYLRKWIADKNNKLKEGRDFSIMWYGGSLLKYATYEAEDDVETFVELSKINVNSAIIMDNDIPEKRKQRVKQSFDENDRFVWITKGKEIENYINKDVFENAVRKVHPQKGAHYSIDSDDLRYNRTILTKEKTQNIDKVKVARLVVKEPTDFGVLDLDPKVENLVNWIKKACNKK